MAKRRQKKPRTKMRKLRNLLAVDAWQRHAGPMRNKKKERLKKLCKEKVKDE